MKTRLAQSYAARPGFGFVPQPREQRVEIDCRFRLGNDVSSRLNAHAARLKRAPSELLADIVEKVLADDLVVAVLDEGR